jgi:hypothetical protein
VAGFASEPGIKPFALRRQFDSALAQSDRAQRRRANRAKLPFFALAPRQNNCEASKHDSDPHEIISQRVT